QDPGGFAEGIGHLPGGHFPRDPLYVARGLPGEHRRDEHGHGSRSQAVRRALRVVDGTHGNGKPIVPSDGHPLTPRRPINPQALAPYTAEQKLARPLASRPMRSVSISREQLAAVVRAEVGAQIPVPAYLYRIYVPVAQIIWES